MNVSLVWIKFENLNFLFLSDFFNNAFLTFPKMWKDHQKSSWFFVSPKNIFPLMQQWPAGLKMVLFIFAAFHMSFSWELQWPFPINCRFQDTEYVLVFYLEPFCSSSPNPLLLSRTHFLMINVDGGRHEKKKPRFLSFFFIPFGSQKKTEKERISKIPNFWTGLF